MSKKHKLLEHNDNTQEPAKKPKIESEIEESNLQDDLDVDEELDQEKELDEIDVDDEEDVEEEMVSSSIMLILFLLFSDRWSWVY
jgi:hypothetical protein